MDSGPLLSFLLVAGALILLATLLARYHYLLRYFAYLLIYACVVSGFTTYTRLSTIDGSLGGRARGVVLTIILSIIVWVIASRFWEWAITSDWGSGTPARTTDAVGTESDPRANDAPGRFAQWKDAGYPIGNWKLSIGRRDGDEVE